MGCTDDCARLALDPFLEVSSLSRLSTLKFAVLALLESLQKVRRSLVDDTAAHKARQSSAAVDKVSGFFGSGGSSAHGSIVYKSAVDAVDSKYTSLNSAVVSTPFYVFTSTTFFEPENSTARYRWVESLALSCPVVVVKHAVSGNIGTLVFVIGRRPGVEMTDDLGEIEDAKAAILLDVPKFELRATRKLFLEKNHMLCNLSKAAASALYKELTGDETVADSLEKKKREAAFVHAFVTGVGDPDLLADLRTLENAKRLGSSSFEGFWECTHEHLGSLKQNAEERRHGGVVVYASEVISHQVLYDAVVVKFEAKKAAGLIGADELVPSLRWLEFQFWPANEHVKSALAYVGQFPLVMGIQQRVLRKYHEHVDYCMAQKSLAENWGRKFLPYVILAQVDDKANGDIGEPGTAVPILARQKRVSGTISGKGNLGRASVGVALAADHDCGNSKTGVIPSVTLKIDLTRNENDSLYRGQVIVKCKDKLLQKSEACRAAVELKRTLMEEEDDGKTVLIKHCDGGGEHNVKHPSVIFANVCLFLSSRGKFDKVNASFLLLFVWASRLARRTTVLL